MILPSLQSEPEVYQITRYADNVPFLEGLAIYLWGRDWCEFVKQPFFLELAKYLVNQQIPGSKKILDMAQGSTETLGS